MRNQMNSNSQKTALALIFAASLSLTAIPAFADSYDFEQAGKTQNQGQTLGNGGAIHTLPTHTTTTTTTNTQAVEGKAQHDNVSDAGEAGQSIGEDAASATKAACATPPKPSATPPATSSAASATACAKRGNSATTSFRKRLIQLSST